MALSFDALAGIGISVLIFLGVLILASLIYVAVTVWTIAAKLNMSRKWLLFIPFANFYFFTLLAELPWWTSILIFITPINIGIFVWGWWKISVRRNRPGWFGFLMFVPLVNFLILGVLAWTESKDSQSENSFKSVVEEASAQTVQQVPQKSVGIPVAPEKIENPPQPSVPEKKGPVEY